MTSKEAKRSMTTPEGKCSECGKTSHKATSRQLWKCYWKMRHRNAGLALRPS